MAKYTVFALKNPKPSGNDWECIVDRVTLTQARAMAAAVVEAGGYARSAIFEAKNAGQEVESVHAS